MPGLFPVEKITSRGDTGSMIQERRTDGLFVGPAGWSYDDWKKLFYPSSKADPLKYTAGYFNCVELNSSFYRTPADGMVRGWLQRLEGISPFVFTVKANSRFTHERVLIDSEADEFVDRFEPLAENDRLGSFLLQFPWSFRNGKTNRQYLIRAAAAFGRYPVTVELRHGSWNSLDTLDLFSDHGISFCNIDQPVIGNSMPPTDYVTSPRLAYIRLHGRNRETWFEKTAGRDRRYDYLYSPEDIRIWAERAKSMLEKSKKLFIITNNHFRGQALVNAFQLQTLLGKRKASPPDSLENAYPDLR